MTLAQGRAKFNGGDRIESRLSSINLVEGDFDPEQLLQLLLSGRMPRDLRSKQTSWSAMQREASLRVAILFCDANSETTVMLCGAVLSFQAVLGPTGRKASLAIVDAFNS